MNEWISKPTSYLNQEEMENNATIFIKFFQGLGWTNECIAAMLGNIQTESHINPGLWEGREIPADPLTTEQGYGLTQWTPANKLIMWAQDNGLDYMQGDTQLERIHYEQQNNIQWSLDNILHMSWDEFIASHESPETLARVFVWAYEIPGDPDIELRQQQARNWYNFIQQVSRLPIWLLFKFQDWRKWQWK